MRKNILLKNIFICLIFFSGLKLWATDYTYNGTWSPSVPNFNNISAGDTLTFNADFSNNETISVAGTIIVSPGKTVRFQGTSSFESTLVIKNSGSLTFDLSVSLPSGSNIYNFTGANFTTTNGLTNAGTIINYGTLTSPNGLTNTGTINNTGSLDITNAITNSGTITSSGTIYASTNFENTGNVTNTGAVSAAGGISNTGSGSFDNTNGVIVGTTSGTITGNVTNTYVFHGTSDSNWKTETNWQNNVIPVIDGSASAKIYLQHDLNIDVIAEDFSFFSNNADEPVTIYLNGYNITCPKRFNLDSSGTNTLTIQGPGTVTVNGLDSKNEGKNYLKLINSVTFNVTTTFYGNLSDDGEFEISGDGSSVLYIPASGADVSWGPNKVTYTNIERKPLGSPVTYTITSDNSSPASTDGLKISIGHNGNNSAAAGATTSHYKVEIIDPTDSFTWTINGTSDFDIGTYSPTVTYNTSELVVKAESNPQTALPAGTGIILTFLTPDSTEGTGISSTPMELAEIRYVQDEVKWKGTSTTWSDLANWDGISSLADLATAEQVIIPSGCTNYPSIGTGTVKNLVIKNGAHITVTGTLTVNGGIECSGTGYIDSSTGTIEFAGTTTTWSATYPEQSKFGTLSVSSGTFAPASDVYITNSLATSGGTYDATTNAVTTCLRPSAGGTATLSNTSGTIKIQTLDCTNQGGKELAVTGGINVTTMHLSGNSGSSFLKVTGDGSFILPSNQSGGEFLDITGASVPTITGKTYTITNSLTPASLPSGWAIGDPATYTWQGTSTSWTTNTNWSSGIVPGSGATVVIPAGCSEYPQLTANLDLGTGIITIEENAVFDLNGHYVIASEFILEGTLVNKGTELITATVTLGTNYTLKFASTSCTINTTLFGTTIPNIFVTGSLTTSSNLQVETFTNEGTTTLGGSLTVTTLTNEGTITASTNTLTLQEYNGATDNSDAISITTGSLTITSGNTSEPTLGTVTINGGTITNSSAANALTITKFTPGTTQSTLAGGTKGIVISEIDGTTGKLETSGSVSLSGTLASLDVTAGTTTLSGDSTIATLTTGGTTSLSGTLQVTDVTIGTAGILNANNNNITVAGNWTNSHTSIGGFTAGTGTVEFTGTEKVISGPTAFNDVTVSGKSTFSGGNTFNDVTVSAETIFSANNTFNDVTISAITTFSGDNTFNDVTVSAETTFSADNTFNEVTISADTTFGGSNTFAKLSCTSAGGKTLTFTGGTTTTVTSTLELSGSSNSSFLKLAQTGTGNWALDTTGATTTVQYLQVEKSTSTVELTATDSQDLGANVNWSFPGCTYTWQGADATDNTDWTKPANWSPASVPGEDTKIIIGDGSTTPKLAAGVKIDTLTINSEKSLDLNNNNLICNTLKINGTLIFNASETIQKQDASATALDSDSADYTLEFNGTGSLSSSSLFGSSIPTVKIASSGNLTTSGNIQIATLTNEGTTTLGGSLTVTNLTNEGSITASTNALTVQKYSGAVDNSDAISITTGSLTITSENTSAPALGSVSINGGTITNSSTANALTITKLTPDTTLSTLAGGTKGIVISEIDGTTGKLKTTGIVSLQDELDELEVDTDSTVTLTTATTIATLTNNGTLTAGGLLSVTNLTNNSEIINSGNNITIGTSYTGKADSSDKLTLSGGAITYNGTAAISLGTVTMTDDVTLAHSGTSATATVNALSISDGKKLTNSGKPLIITSLILTDSTETTPATLEAGTDADITITNALTEGYLNTSGSVSLSGTLASLNVTAGTTTLSGDSTIATLSTDGTTTLAGTLQVTDVTIGTTGILNANNNNITVAGIWTNSHTTIGGFTAGTATVEFTGAEKEISGPTAFNDVTVSGKSTFSGDNTFNDVTVSAETIFSANNTFNDVTISAITTFSGGNTFHDVTVSAETTFSANNTFNDVTISADTTFGGSNTFAKLSCTSAGGKTLTFTGGTTTTVTSTLELSGSSNSSFLKLAQTGTGNWALDTTGATTQTVQYLQVEKSTSTVELTATDSQDFGSNIKWNFPNQVYEWKATAEEGHETEWANAANWYPSSIPGRGAVVKIQQNSSEKYPVLSTAVDLDTTKDSSLLIDENASLDLNGKALSVKTFTLNGKLRLKGPAATEIITLAAGTENKVLGTNYTLDYYGDNSLDTTFFNTTIPNVIIEAGATVNFPDNTTVTTLTTDGTTSLSGTLQVTDVTIGTAGILNANDNNITVAGNWTNSHTSIGGFTAGTGSVKFTDIEKEIAGPTAFNDVTVSGKSTFSGENSFNDVTVSAETTFSADNSFHDVTISAITTFSGDNTFNNVTTSAGTTFGGSNTFNDAVFKNTVTLSGENTFETLKFQDDGATSSAVTSKQTVNGITYIENNSTAAVELTSTDNTFTGGIKIGSAAVAPETTPAYAGPVTLAGKTSATQSLNLNGDAFAASLTIQSPVTINGNVTTTGTQTYSSAASVTINADSTFKGSNISFGSTVDDATAETHTLTLEGPTTFGGIVGTTKLKQIDASSSVTINTIAVSTSDAQTYTGPVTIGADTAISASVITFNSTVDDATANQHALTLQKEVHFNGAVGGTKALKSISQTDAASSVTVNCEKVASSDSQSYAGTVTINAASTVSSSNISFAKPVTVDATSTITGATIAFLDTLAVNATTTVTGTTSTTFSANVTDSATNEITINGPVILANDITFEPQTVTFNGTINSALGTNKALTINKTVAFNGKIGEIDALSSITTQNTDATKSTILNAASITTTGTQNFKGAVTIGEDTTLSASVITFNSTVDDATANQHALTLEKEVHFNGAVGSTKALKSISQTDAASSVIVNCAKVASSDSQSYAGTVTISAASTVSSSNISFAKPVTVDATSTITGATIAFLDTLAVNAATTVTGTTSTTFSANVTDSATNEITINGPVILANDITFEPQTVTFNGTVDDATANQHALTLQKEVHFNGAVGSTKALNAITQTDAASSVTINCTNVATSASQTYTGPVTLNADATLTASNINFMENLVGATTKPNLTLQNATVTFGNDYATDSVTNFTQITIVNNTSGNITVSAATSQISNIINWNFTGTGTGTTNFQPGNNSGNNTTQTDNHYGKITVNISGTLNFNNNDFMQNCTACHESTANDFAIETGTVKFGTGIIILGNLKVAAGAAFIQSGNNATSTPAKEHSITTIENNGSIAWDSTQAGGTLNINGSITGTNSFNIVYNKKTVNFNASIPASGIFWDLHIAPGVNLTNSNYIRVRHNMIIDSTGAYIHDDKQLVFGSKTDDEATNNSSELGTALASDGGTITDSNTTPNNLGAVTVNAPSVTKSFATDSLFTTLLITANTTVDAAANKVTTSADYTNKGTFQSDGTKPVIILGNLVNEGTFKNDGEVNVSGNFTDTNGTWTSLNGSNGNILTLNGNAFQTLNPNAATVYPYIILNKPSAATGGVDITEQLHATKFDIASCAESSFQKAVTIDTLTNSATSGTITFHHGGTIAKGGAAATDPVTFNTTGLLTINDEPTDSITFTSSVVHTAGQTIITGTINSGADITTGITDFQGTMNAGGTITSAKTNLTQNAVYNAGSNISFTDLISGADYILKLNSPANISIKNTTVKTLTFEDSTAATPQASTASIKLNGAIVTESDITLPFNTALGGASSITCPNAIFPTYITVDLFDKPFEITSYVLFNANLFSTGATAESTNGVTVKAASEGSTAGAGSGNVIINDLETNTVEINAPLKAENLVVYNGKLKTSANITTVNDLVFYGKAYNEKDQQSGIENIYFYYEPRNFEAPEGKLPDGTTAPLPPAETATQTVYSAALETAGTVTIKVGQNFYANGLTATGNADWNLKLKPNKNTKLNYAAAFYCNFTDSPCHVSSWQDDAQADAVCIAAEACTVKTDYESGWDLADFTIADAYTVHDDILCIEFDRPVRNIDNILNATNTERITNSNGKYTEIYSDIACTTPLAADSTIQTIYLKSNVRWNTDATGSNAGRQTSTDTYGVHQTTKPFIDVKRSTGNDIAAGQYNFFITDLYGKRINQYNASGTGAVYTLTHDRCSPVMVTVKTGQELHDVYDSTVGEASQHSYDSHNFIEFSYSEAVNFGSADTAVCDVWIPSLNAQNEPNITENIKVTSQFGQLVGDITQSGKLTFQGIGTIAAGKLYTGNNGQIAKDANALYRKNEYSLCISIAGYTDGTINDRDGNLYKNWKGYIESAEMPSGAYELINPSELNSFVTDLDGNKQKTASVEINVNSTENGLYGRWDLSEPTFAICRLDITKEWKWYGDSFAEAVGTGSGSTLDRIEFHFFDNTPTYSADDTAIWFTQKGWIENKTYDGSAEPNLYDASYTYCADIIGGARQFDSVAARRTSGGIRYSTTAPIPKAFKYAKTIGNPNPNLPFIEDISGVYPTVASTIFTGSSSPRRSVEDPDGLYFGLGLQETGLPVETTFTVAYDETQGYLTDLAGNRMRSSIVSTIDRTPPTFDLCLSPINQNEIQIIFVKELKTDSNKLQFLDASNSKIPISEKFEDLIPNCFDIISIDANGTPTLADIQIDKTKPAQITIFNAVGNTDSLGSSTFTFIKLKLTRNLTLKDIQTLHLRLTYDPNYPERSKDPITSINDARVTFIQDQYSNYMPMYTAHALSDFVIGAINPLYAYDQNMMYGDENIMEGMYQEGSWAVHDWEADQQNYGTLPHNHPLAMVIDLDDGTAEKQNLPSNVRLFMSEKPDEGTVATQFNTDFAKSLRVWLPEVSNGLFPGFALTNNTHYSQVDSQYLNTDLANGLLFDINKDITSTWASGDQISFLFGLLNNDGTPFRIYNEPFFNVSTNKYDFSKSTKVPLYSLRLHDPTDVMSLDLWSFKVRATTEQQGGVSIFNNVINSADGEKAIIKVNMPSAGKLNVTVMTLDGNIVQYLAHGQTTAGEHYYSWNGKNKKGTPVARGMYFIRVVGSGFDETRKVMVVK